MSKIGPKEVKPSCDDPAQRLAGLLNVNPRYPDGKGDYGYPVGYTPEGNYAEWIPDESTPEKVYRRTILRSVDSIESAYREHQEKVLWNTTKDIVKRAQIGELAFNVDSLAAELRAIEGKYGIDNLSMSDADLNFIRGRMSALAWVRGWDWDQWPYGNFSKNALNVSRKDQ